jgi:transmembrane sensor
MSYVETTALTEAAAWRARLTEADAGSTPEFAAWLATDPRNIVAWKRVQEPWDLVGEQATAPEIIELRRAALEHVHAAGRRRWTRSPRFVFARRVSAAAVVLVVIVAGLLVWQGRRPDVYTTHAGERHVVTLADGSRIALDSRTEVRVRYTSQARELELVSGQARFDVARDVTRPFSVIADGHKVVATGTAFNVDLFASSLFVTLIEGRVVVLSEPVPNAAEPLTLPRLTLDVGDQLVLTPSAPPSVEHVSIERTTAWENGEIVFENDRLASVVARINRYARQPVVIVDAETAELRISGVFHTGDVEGFVSTLVSYLPVQAERGADGVTRLAQR